jgi:DNA-binding winged helix-turn-helix (wHTH) protein/tetratricopeptide (TPR) repeat protein
VPKFSLGRIVIDTTERLITTSIGRVRLKEPEARLLERLAAAGGKVVTKETLLDELWNGRSVDDKNLVMLIGRARRTLSQFFPGKCPLITVHGKGYQLLGCAPLGEAATREESEAGRVREPHEGRLSIAMQPFRHATQSEPLKSIADSLCESLAIRLSACCRVIPAFPVEKSADLVERAGVALESGAPVPDFILTGSVFESGERLRVNVQLADPVTAEIIWGHQASAERRSQFELEDEIAEKVFAHVAGLVQGTSGDYKFDGAGRTTFHSYVLGRHFMAKRSSQGILRARELFESTLTENESFSPGLAELACCMAISPYYFERDSRTAAYSAIDAAKLALRFDPNCAAAYSALGFAYLTLRSRTAARASLEKAIELGGDDSRAYRFFADYHVWSGDFARAVFCASRSVDLDPASPVANADCAQTLFYSRRYEDALSSAERSLQLDDAFANGHHMAAQILRQMGRTEEAAEAAERSYSLSPQSDLFRLNALSFGGNPAGTVKRRREASAGDSSRRPATGDYGHALFHAWRGEVEQSLDYLKRCVDECAPFSLFINADPNLDAVRGHGSFPAIAGQLQCDRGSLEAILSRS